MAYKTTPQHGKDAQFEVGGTVIGFENSWSLNISRDTSSIDRKGQDAKEVMVGQYGFSGTISVHFVPGDSVQIALVTAFLNGTEITNGKFRLDASGTSGNVLKGSFFINSMPISSPIGDKVSCQFGIVGNGVIAISNAG
jgi:hypothetical protein